MEIFTTTPITTEREKTIRMCQEVFLDYAIKNLSVTSIEVGEECEIKLRLFSESEVKKFTKEQLKRGMVIHFCLIEFSVMIKGDSLLAVTQKLFDRIKNFFSNKNRIYEIRQCIIKVPELKAIQDFFFHLQMVI